MKGVLDNRCKEMDAIQATFHGDCVQCRKIFLAAAAMARAVGPVRRPQIGVIRHGRVLGIEPLRRRVEQAVPFARDARDDFRRHAAPRPRFAHAQQSSRARHAGHHRVGVERFHGAQIHHFNFPAFGGKFRRRFQASWTIAL